MKTKSKISEESKLDLIGGDERVRTAGLLLARQALSQLSYTPTIKRTLIITEQIKSKRIFKLILPQQYSRIKDYYPVALQ